MHAGSCEWARPITYGFLDGGPPTKTDAFVDAERRALGLGSTHGVRPEIIKEIQDKAVKKAAREQAELARDALAIKTAEEHVLFDAAVAAEAKRLHRNVSSSTQFVDAVTPGLKERGIVAGRSKILEAVKRLKTK
jgi:hypothetical protein